MVSDVDLGDETGSALLPVPLFWVNVGEPSASPLAALEGAGIMVLPWGLPSYEVDVSDKMVVEGELYGRVTIPVGIVYNPNCCCAWLTQRRSLQ